MKVGVPTEVKADEYRVALTPAGVRELVDAGPEAYVQSGAGTGSAITDEAYAAQAAVTRRRRAAQQLTWLAFPARGQPSARRPAGGLPQLLAGPSCRPAAWSAQGSR